MKRFLYRLVLRSTRRLLLYACAAVLLVAVGKGLAFTLPGYVRAGDVARIVVGAMIWGSLLFLAIACLVLAERKGGAREPRSPHTPDLPR